MSCLFVCLFICCSDVTNLLFFRYKRIPELDFFFSAVLIREGKRREGENPSNQHWTWGHTRYGATGQAPKQPPECLETQPRQSHVTFLLFVNKREREQKWCQWTWLLGSGEGVIFAVTNGNHISLQILWDELSFGSAGRCADSPSGVPGNILLFCKSASAFTPLWIKDLWCLAGTPGTWWMREMESSTSWFCAGAKAMAGELLQQNHCHCCIGVWGFFWSYFHFVQSSPRLRHRLKHTTAPTAPFPAYFSPWPPQVHIFQFDSLELIM